MGAAGQVGRALLHSVPPGADVLGLTHEQLDISDALAVHRTVAAYPPELLINAAAYTAVDRAEAEPEPEREAAINAEGARHLAEAVHGIAGSRLIQISTDYVFDGRSAVPYAPDDAPNPINVYGRTKFEGERAALAVLGSRAVVLRTAWGYASQEKNFLLTMLRLMRERSAVRVIADQRGSPTCAVSIARAIWRIAEIAQVRGVLHWTDAGTASWYDFACAIAAEGMHAGVLREPVGVTPITTAEYPTAAVRPANSMLDLRKSVGALSLVPLPWREALGVTLRELI